MQLYIPVPTHILSCVGSLKFCPAAGISASQSNHAMIFVHHEKKNHFTQMGALSRNTSQVMHPFVVSIQTTNSQLKRACFTCFPTIYHVSVLVVIVVCYQNNSFTIVFSMLCLIYGPNWKPCVQRFAIFVFVKALTT